MELKSELYKKHKIFFIKSFDGWVRYFIDSKDNYTGDAESKEEAFNDAKKLIDNNDFTHVR